MEWTSLDWWLLQKMTFSNSTMYLNFSRTFWQRHVFILVVIDIVIVGRHHTTRSSIPVQISNHQRIENNFSKTINIRTCPLFYRMEFLIFDWSGLIPLPYCLRLSGVHVSDERPQAEKDKARTKVTGGLLAAMQQGTTYGGCLPGGLGSCCYQQQGNKFIVVIDLLEAIEIWSKHSKQGSKGKGTDAGASASTATMSMRDPCRRWRWRDVQLQSQSQYMQLYAFFFANQSNK